MLNRRGSPASPDRPKRSGLVGTADSRSRIIMALWTYQVCMSRLGGDALQRLPCGPCGRDRLHSVWADGESYCCYHCLIVGRHPALKDGPDLPMMGTKTRRCRVCEYDALHLTWPAAVGAACVTCLYRRKDQVKLYAEVAEPLPEAPRRRSPLDLVAALFR